MKKQIITTLAFTTIFVSKSFGQWGNGTMNTQIQTTNGYVGIGTAAPLSKLTIWDNSNTSDESQMIRLGMSSTYDYRIFRQKSDGVLRFDGNQTTFSSFRFSTTAASYALSILNSGNVGIGISNPGAKLEVAGQVKITGGSPAAGRVLTSDVNGLASWVPLTSINSGGTANYIPKWSSTNGLSATSLIYDDGSNVGIGITTPSKRLHVVGDAQIDNLSFTSYAGNSWVDASTALLLNYYSKKETNINTGWILQTDATGNTTATQNGGQVNLGAKVALTNSLKLGWDGNGVDLNTNIEVNQNANNASAVKVKTWNGSIKAFSIQDVNNINSFLVYGSGNTVINGSHAAYTNVGHFDIVNSTLGTSAGNKEYFTNFGGSVGSGNFEQLRIFQNRHTNGTNWNSSEIKLQKRVDATDMHYISFKGTPTMGSVLSFGYGTTEFMKLTEQGQLAIGSQTMSGIHSDAKLTVYGKIVSTSMYVTQLNWADFVFEKDYKLPTLTEIEDYYTKHKHLPNIPSAKEVSEQGINVGEMNKLLLQKIEELTILMVEQNKRIKEIESKK